MGLLKYFQKIKWEILAKLDPNYYAFSDKFISQDKEKYQQSGRDDFREFILKDEYLKESLKNSQSKICLEFGCGNGRMTEFLADIFGRVYALDISEKMIKLAKRRLSDIENIIYIKSNGEKINCPDNSVDFIFSYTVLQHFPTKNMVKNILKEFYKVMKNGGLAKIQIRGRAAYGGIFRYFKWYYGVFFSKSEILDILREIGFKVIKIEGEKTKLFWLLIKK